MTEDTSAAVRATGLSAHGNSEMRVRLRDSEVTMTRSQMSATVTGDDDQQTFLSVGLMRPSSVCCSVTVSLHDKSPLVHSSFSGTAPFGWSVGSGNPPLLCPCWQTFRRGHPAPQPSEPRHTECPQKCRSETCFLPGPSLD